MDRIDIRIPVERQGPVIFNRSEKIDIQEENRREALQSVKNTRQMSKQIARAIQIQRERFSRRSGSLVDRQLCRRNADMNTAHIQKYCSLSQQTSLELKNAVIQLGLSTRAEYSVLKIARTIADIEQSDSIRNEHLLEAVHYRRFAEGDYFWSAA